MRRYFARWALSVPLLAIPVTGPLVHAPIPVSPGGSAGVRAQLSTGIDSLISAIDALSRLPADGDSAVDRAAFRRARGAYKRVEYLVPELLPEAESVLNGPALPRPNESSPGGVLQPSGLQVIEAALYPRRPPRADTLLAAQVRRLAPTLASLRTVRLAGPTADTRILAAVRMELARIATLGIAGFDATLSGDALVESAEALRGVRSGLAAYRPLEIGSVLMTWTALDRQLVAAIAALDSSDFNAFDRLAFIQEHARPTARALSAFQAALGVVRTGRPNAWAMTADGIFDPGALDPFDYAPSDAAALGPEIVALGRRLFGDARLSADGRRSCATCHQPGHAFTDGLARARVDHGSGPVRNTPTLLNAALQPFQFADQRARALEDQVAAVLANPREMNLPLEDAVHRLRGDAVLVGAFATAYGRARDDALSARGIQIALAAFVRSLVAVNSPLDRAVQGDRAALSPAERRGFNLFMGKAACGTCHFAPTFGGALPPALLTSEPEVIGVPSRPVMTAARIDGDPGVAEFDHEPIHRHAFKTPSLRNVALTAPYMHNGVYRTLEEVVEFYDRGGGAGIGINLPNQTLSTEPLRLSRADKRALVSFLRALTDTVATRGSMVATGRAASGEQAGTEKP